jgi:hypothetical protein
MRYDEPRLVWTGCTSRTSEHGGKGDCVKGREDLEGPGEKL